MARKVTNSAFVKRNSKNHVVMFVGTSRTRFLPRRKETLPDENNEARNGDWNERFGVINDLVERES